MNTDEKEAYNPADDDNQGVVQLMAQGEEPNAGVSQADYMNPVKAQGPEPEKAEVDESAIDGVNDDVLIEKAVENDEIELDNK